MYVAVKGGEQAIEASYRLLDQLRRGDPALARLQLAQIREQLPLLVSRVMAEASVLDESLAALAIRQAAGDVVEAVFLLRAYRTTLPRLGQTLPLDTRAMRIDRRVSAVFKDLPGGQILGPTFDYTQRLLDFSSLDDEAPVPLEPACPQPPAARQTPDALARLADEGLIETADPDPGDPDPPDITRDPPRYPLERPARLQMMARADEGWLLGMGYSSQRGYAHTHPFGGDIRLGRVEVQVAPEELGFAIVIGEVQLTECQMINQFTGSADLPPAFTRGYGLVAGHNERKAMAMSLVDRVMRHDEFDELPSSPAQDQEFVLPHSDSVEASGFVQHLKLPHYVTFESELQLIRQLRAEHGQSSATPAGSIDEQAPR
ncbi:MAG: carbon-phosphorus lyase complex subunit PhnI [Burkholderiaceae bacterium]